MAALSSLALLGCGGCASAGPWVAIWATAPLDEAAPPELRGRQPVVLRQVVRISDGAGTVRVRLSNEYGDEPLALEDVRLALAAPDGAVRAQTGRPVAFSGASGVSIPPRSWVTSDPVSFPAPAHADLAVTALVAGLPGRVAGHPGSRATSYVKPGAGTADETLPGATRIVHWYFLSGIDTIAGAGTAAAVVCLGDSITDGHGCEPDQNTRWTDSLSRRLRANPATASIAVLNLGIGGGRLLRPGLGPPGVARLPRDVFGQPGARWVILQLGVNDLGTRIKARAAGQAYASAQDIIAGYRQVLAACRGRGIRTGLATISPFAGAKWYSTPDIESDRQAINTWIREAAPCDRVIDFDAALRDPSRPTLLLPEYDSGDHLHPSMAGYRRMAESVPMDFFAPAGQRAD